MKCWFVLPKVQRRKRLQLMQQQEWERDSLLLAACGYEVTMYEQNPVIAILLKDAIRRAKRRKIHS